MQMNKNILALMPVFVFMIIMLIVSIYVRRASAKKASEGGQCRLRRLFCQL